MRILLRVGLVVAGLAAADAARALGPQELALLVNSNSPASLEVANHYVQLRGLPPENVVFLGLPDSARGSAAEFTPEEFTRLIWTPATATLKARGVDGTILAWAFSCDFPIRATTSPAVSVPGLVFVRNQMPESSLVTTGLYPSALFRGPARAGGPASPASTLENLASGLGYRMPLPAMMLTWTGARGLTPAEAVALLQRSREADGSRPDRPVYFVESADVRSRCRAWQFPAAAAELKALGVEAVISSNFPAGRRKVMGVMAGSASVDCASVASFAPGAVGEHLTSWAAVFHNPDQSKLTAWLRAGASASAGTVVEPLSIWTKFPSARLFVHYARGCTLLESFAQSVACPLQLLPVGDPLLSPWTTSFTATIVPVKGAKGRIALTVRTAGDAAPGKAKYLIYLDGRLRGATNSPDVEWPADGLADGVHEVRAVVYGEGEVRPQATATIRFTAREAGRSVRIADLPGAGADFEFQPGHRATRADFLRPMRVKVEAEGQPSRLGLFCLGRPLAQTGGVAAAELTFAPAAAGAGPVEIQPVAVYPDGMVVRGEPRRLFLEPRNQPPAIRTLTAKSAEGGAAFAAGVSDADGDAIACAWFQPLFAARPADLRKKAVLSGGKTTVSHGVLTLATDVTPSNRLAVCAWPAADAREFVAELAGGAERAGELGREAAYLAYDHRDSTNFSFFGFEAEHGAWVLGSCKDGQWSLTDTRGAPLRSDAWYAAGVRATADGFLEARVNGELLFRRARPVGPLGAVALVAGALPVRFRAAARAVAEGPVSPAVKAGERLLLRASDGFEDTWRETGGPTH